MSTSRTADKFVVRLPDGMRDRIAQLAKENHRSMNSEMVIRLKESMEASTTEHANQTLVSLQESVDRLTKAVSRKYPQPGGRNRV